MSDGRSAESATAALLTGLVGLPFFRVDARRDVVELSPEMERLTGFRKEEVLGRSCLVLHRCEECLRGCGVIEEGVVCDKHLRLFRADGTSLEVLKSGFALHGPDGEPAGAIEFVRPIIEDETKSPETDEEARRIRAALERAQYRRTEAARVLGVSRTTLWRKMRALGL